MELDAGNKPKFLDLERNPDARNRDKILELALLNSAI